MANVLDQGKSVLEEEFSIVFDSRKSGVFRMIVESIEAGAGDNDQRREAFSTLGEEDVPGYDSSWQDYHGFPNLKKRHVLLFEADAVNYEQAYFDVNVETIQKILEVVAEHGLEVDEDSQKLLESLKEMVASGSAKGVQQARTFDARLKKKEKNEEVLPLSIDFKFSPTEENPNLRGQLSFAALSADESQTNSEEAVMTAIDDLKVALDVKKMDRKFVGYGWLPHIMLEWFDLKNILQDVDEETAHKVYDCVAEELAVKLDARFDVDDGLQVATAEVEMPKPKEPKVGVEVKATERQTAEAIVTALERNGLLYASKDFNSSQSCLDPQAQATLCRVLAEKVGADEAQQCANFSARTVSRVHKVLEHKQVSVPAEGELKAQRLGRVKTLGDPEAVKVNLASILKDAGYEEKADQMMALVFDK